MIDLMWRPHWSKTPNVRYPASEFDLSSDRARDRDATYNPRDSNNNYEDGVQDVSYEVVEKKAQMDHIEDTPTLASEDYEEIIDADNISFNLQYGNILFLNGAPANIEMGGERVDNGEQREPARQNIGLQMGTKESKGPVEDSTIPLTSRMMSSMTISQRKLMRTHPQVASINQISQQARDLVKRHTNQGNSNQQT